MWESFHGASAGRDLCRRRSGVSAGHRTVAARLRTYCRRRITGTALASAARPATWLARITWNTCWSEKETSPQWWPKPSGARHSLSLRWIIEKIRAACDKHGAADFGRNPHRFGAHRENVCLPEHYGITPDILVLGKGLGGGIFPLAAMLARESLNVATDKALGHYTHEKNPVACAAGLATLRVIEEENLVQRAEALGRGDRRAAPPGHSSPYYWRCSRPGTCSAWNSCGEMAVPALQPIELSG